MVLVFVIVRGRLLAGPHARSSSRCTVHHRQWRSNSLEAFRPQHRPVKRPTSPPYLGIVALSGNQGRRALLCLADTPRAVRTQGSPLPPGLGRIKERLSCTTQDAKLRFSLGNSDNSRAGASPVFPQRASSGFEIIPIRSRTSLVVGRFEHNRPKPLRSPFDFANLDLPHIMTKCIVATISLE